LETALILFLIVGVKLLSGVSILVLLETALIPISDHNSHSVGSVLFQSLFYWKLLSYNTAIRSWGWNSNDVSILVLLETALILGCWNNPPIRVYQEFQSLFYWKLLSYRARDGERILVEPGFNPCFIGNCSHTKKGDKNDS